MRQQPDAKLRQLYEKAFYESVYYIKWTPDIHRDYIEKRLFYAYALKHPCYPKGSDELRHFKKVAKSVFLEPPESAKKRQGGRDLKRDVKKRMLFTKRNIRKMSEKEVDAYLTMIGITLTDVGIAYKRKVLWEFFNLRTRDLPLLKSNAGKRKAAIRPKKKNKFELTQLILAFPSMGWPEFQEAFGDVMPTVQRQTFYSCRYKIKKRYGPDALPKLLPGARKSQVRVRWDINNRIKGEAPDPETVQELKDQVLEFRD